MARREVLVAALDDREATEVVRPIARVATAVGARVVPAATAAGARVVLAVLAAATAAGARVVLAVLAAATAAGARVAAGTAATAAGARAVPAGVPAATPAIVATAVALVSGTIALAATAEVQAVPEAATPAADIPVTGPVLATQGADPGVGMPGGGRAPVAATPAVAQAAALAATPAGAQAAGPVDTPAVAQAAGLAATPAVAQADDRRGGTGVPTPVRSEGPLARETVVIRVGPVVVTDRDPRSLARAVVIVPGPAPADSPRTTRVTLGARGARALDRRAALRVRSGAGSPAVAVGTAPTRTRIKAVATKVGRVTGRAGPDRTGPT